MLRRLRRVFRRPRGIAALAPPAPMTMAERIEMAARCRDCDGMPKVVEAGEVIVADGARVQVMHNGVRVLADGYCGAWMTELIRRCRGHHEPQEERVVDAVFARLPADATMLELGAWWSFYSLWFLRGMPARRAWALEPDPERRALGAANAALNGCGIVFIDGFVAADPADAADFTLESGARIRIPRRSVPQIMAAQGIATLDLLHCDAQGAELAVLASCAPLLREGRIRTVIVSTHHHSISGDPLTHQRCLAAIQACGGAVFAEHDVHESFSGDGLIAARFGPDRGAWPVVPLSRNRYATSLFRNPLYDLAAALHTRA